MNDPIYDVVGHHVRQWDSGWIPVGRDSAGVQIWWAYHHCRCGWQAWGDPEIPDSLWQAWHDEADSP